MATVDMKFSELPQDIQRSFKGLLDLKSIEYGSRGMVFILRTKGHKFPKKQKDYPGLAKFIPMTPRLIGAMDDHHEIVKSINMVVHDDEAYMEIVLKDMETMLKEFQETQKRLGIA